jgi:hypothetical protein
MLQRQSVGEHARLRVILARRSIMKRITLAALAAMPALAFALSCLACPGLAHAQTMPNLAGAYRCVPEPATCKWQGQNLTITQSGATVELNINPGETAEGKLTSNITVGAGPPFNSLGLIRPDHSIEWSNGTKWIKQ